MGHLVQMAGLAVQNFLSAAVGLAVAVALIRGLVRTKTDRLGNFWVDITRATLRILLPLSCVFALVLVIGGAVQNFASPVDVTTLTGGTQSITGGPVASQEAIKELGTNGGGFYNANSAHPFENPNSWTNLVEIFMLLLIPSALAPDLWPDGRRQATGLRRPGRRHGAVGRVGGGDDGRGGCASGTVPQAVGAAMEGKEVRFDTWASALFAASTTGTSTGAVNAMHDSFTAAGGGVVLFNMMLGEVSPGGVGAGLYGLVVLAILAVFLAGLMVGRTPEYLGKKIGRREITLVALYVWPCRSRC